MEASTVRDHAIGDALTAQPQFSIVSQPSKILPSSDVTAPGGSPAFWICKRIADVVLSVIGLVFLAAIALAVFALNPFFNPGPLFYRQSRIGRHGRPFRIVKFRTMRPDNSGSWTIFCDECHRVSRFGGLLRRSRLDELPQIRNVLLGDMSLIGPRPEMIEIVQHYKSALPGFNSRHLVRPGISGLSQVTIGYTDCDHAYAQKLERDLDYIRNAGWSMDTRIFFRTLWVVATGFGAR
jgi:lipopolysaccharide/colanic/teichoic acid biosynthesis glycosyltransferase